MCWRTRVDNQIDLVKLLAKILRKILAVPVVGHLQIAAILISRKRGRAAAKNAQRESGSIDRFNYFQVFNDL